MKKIFHSDLVSETRLDSTRLDWTGLDSTSVLGKSLIILLLHIISQNTIVNRLGNL